MVEIYKTKRRGGGNFKVDERCRRRDYRLSITCSAKRGKLNTKGENDVMSGCEWNAPPADEKTVA